LSTLKERIDSHATLAAQEQIALMFELEGGIRDGRSPTEMKDLLLSFKRRDDLLAKVATRIDEALAAIDHAPPAGGRQQAAPAAPASTPRPEPRYQPQAHVAPTPMPPPLSPPRPSGGAKVRRYACRDEDGPVLIENVKRWLDAEGFDSQQMSTETGGLLLQIKKRGGWREFVGMSTSLNIVFNQAADTMTVEIGAGKWIDKAAVGTVSMFVLWPLAFTAGFGAWEQMKMPDKIFGYIGNQFHYA
jgi:hypothetical protein